MLRFLEWIEAKEDGTLEEKIQKSRENNQKQQLDSQSYKRDIFQQIKESSSRIHKG